jgi:Arc/MetJ family transcription regulator
VASLALLIHVRPVNSDYVRLTSTSPHVLHQCAARIVNGGHDGDPLLSPHQVPRGSVQAHIPPPWRFVDNGDYPLSKSPVAQLVSIFPRRGERRLRDRLAWLIDVLELDHSIQAGHFGSTHPTKPLYILYPQLVYTTSEGAPTTKRLIDLDDDLLAAAQRELHTTGVSDTVRIALEQVAAQSARARQIEWLEQGGLESMADSDERREVWR